MTIERSSQERDVSNWREFAGSGKDEQFEIENITGNLYFWYSIAVILRKTQRRTPF
jgi:hypothetical protein